MGYILSYNLAMLPRGMGSREVMDMIRKQGVCLYDSSLDPNQDGVPDVLHVGGDRNSHFLKVQFVDVAKSKRDGIEYE